MALIVVGTACAGAGFFWGKVVVRQTPVEFSVKDLSMLVDALRMEGGQLWERPGGSPHATEQVDGASGIIEADELPESSKFPK
jgi:hypothetical protein